jgi:hypothetical protein
MLLIMVAVVNSQDMQNPWHIIVFENEKEVAFYNTEIISGIQTTAQSITIVLSNGKEFSHPLATTSFGFEPRKEGTATKSNSIFNPPWTVRYSTGKLHFNITVNNIAIYTVTGALVAQFAGNCTELSVHLSSGIYIVQAAGMSAKLAVVVSGNGSTVSQPAIESKSVADAFAPIGLRSENSIKMYWNITISDSTVSVEIPNVEKFYFTADNSLILTMKNGDTNELSDYLKGEFSVEPVRPDADFNNPEKFRLSKILTYSNSSASNLRGETVYEYDTAGNLWKEIFSHEGYSELYVHHYYEYEYLGNKKVKEKLYTCNTYPGGVLRLGHYVDYIYDGDLLIKSETYSGLDGSFVRSDHFEYDERGNLVLDYSYDPSWIGKGVWGGIYETGIFGYRKYIYDNQDRLITVLTTDGVLDFYPCLKYTYDNDGDVIKTEYHEYEGLSHYIENIYNPTGKLLEKVLSFDKNGKQTQKLQHYYDGLGNLTEIVINDECSKFKRKYKGKLLIEEILYWWHEYGYHGTGQMPEMGMSRYEYEELVTITNSTK